MCDIVLNVHKPCEENSDDSKAGFMRNYRRAFLYIFLNTIRKFFLEILTQKWGERIFSNRQLGMIVYMGIVTIMVLE
jgi:hypothetical protein